MHYCKPELRKARATSRLPSFVAMRHKKPARIQAIALIVSAQIGQWRGLGGLAYVAHIDAPYPQGR
jgi:hypothetical protein